MYRGRTIELRLRTYTSSWGFFLTFRLGTWGDVKGFDGCCWRQGISTSFRAGNESSVAAPLCRKEEAVYVSVLLSTWPGCVNSLVTKSLRAQAWAPVLLRSCACSPPPRVFSSSACKNSKASDFVNAHNQWSVAWSSKLTPAIKRHWLNEQERQQTKTRETNTQGGGIVPQGAGISLGAVCDHAGRTQNWLKSLQWATWLWNMLSQFRDNSILSRKFVDELRCTI